MNAIPKGWVSYTVKDIVKKISNGTNEKQISEPIGLPVTRIETISFSKINLNRVKYIQNPSKELIEKYQLHKGDILFSHINSEIHLGKTALFDLDDVVLHGTNLLLIRPDQNIILPKYLNYYFNFLRFSNFFISSGHKSVNQSSINQEKLKSFKINVPSLSMQNKIVQKLDYVLEQTEEKKQQIISLIDQNKERINFFETNWISYITNKEIETHPQRKEWELRKISEVCDLNPPKSEIKDLSDELLVSFVPMKNVDDKEGIIKTLDEKPLGIIRKGYTYFKNNDVIFAKITPCMENGKIAIGSNLQNGIGFASTEFHVLRPRDEILSEFVHYFLRDKSFRMEAKANFTGSAGQQRVPKEFMENHLIPLPSIKIQRQIIQNIKRAEEKFKKQKIQFENIKKSYDSKIKYIDHIQSSILNSAFSGKLVN